MGGCRCSYKNCKTKSDGKTHMFHYPVFDRIRCHQWITNAQKLEFLNLKVSQLKNRVVCQHHFKDDNFMNFMKDKLTFDAVPTEDGPYCDSSQLNNTKPEPDLNMYTISLEDIENDYQSFIDKKANFSVKYGDFLTNSDIMNMDMFSQSDTTTKCKYPETPVLFGLDDNFQAHNPNVIPIEHEEANLTPVNKEPQKKNKDDITVQKIVIQETPPNISQNDSKKSRIVIISEKKISEPGKISLPPSGSLKPISASRILPLPMKARNLNLEQNNASKEGNVFLNVQNTSGNNVAVQAPRVVNKELNESHKPPLIIESHVLNPQCISIETTPKQPEISQIIPEFNNNLNKKTPNRSVIKKTPCISREKMAAIQEKRKFNMKLRDIIESCLDNIEDQEKVLENSKLKHEIRNKISPNNDKNVKMPNNLKYNDELLEQNKMSNNDESVTKIKKNNIEKQQVASYLSNSSEMPIVQEYAVSYLESRMKKMEENLMKKIDQNTVRIIELKNSSSLAIRTKNIQTQTRFTDEVHKKHLYQEISKFLSPAANSLIYEELFINQFALRQKKSPASKRRKCRR